jgi:hypothetical protein
VQYIHSGYLGKFTPLANPNKKFGSDLPCAKTGKFFLTQRCIEDHAKKS